MKEQELAAQLGVSRTPVREALLRLRLEGLVRVVPRGGIFVAEASIRQIREITEVRLVLEVPLSFCANHLLTDTLGLVALWLDPEPQLGAACDLPKPSEALRDVTQETELAELLVCLGTPEIPRPIDIREGALRGWATDRGRCGDVK